MRVHILCFFGDQKYYENASKLMLWPRGINYDRPFRYRSKWIPKRLRESLSNWRGSEALVCMKESSNPDLYVPLRYVKIREVELQGEYTFVHFSVEDFVRYEATYDPDHYSTPSGDGYRLLLHVG